MLISLFCLIKIAKTLCNLLYRKVWVGSSWSRRDDVWLGLEAAVARFDRVRGNQSLAVCLLRAPLSFAVLRHKRLPVMAARKADRGEGEGQEEEIATWSQHCEGKTSEDGLTKMFPIRWRLWSFNETELSDKFLCVMEEKNSHSSVLQLWSYPCLKSFVSCIIIVLNTVCADLFFVMSQTLTFYGQ